MEITWYGLGCFRIVERGYPVVLMDPFDEGASGLKLPRAQVDLVTVSEPSEDPAQLRPAGVAPAVRVLAGPGEYEIGGLFITGIAALRDRRRRPELGQTVIYALNFGGLSVCHLGEVGVLPAQNLLEALGPVNVLLIPVGLPNGLTPAMASEVVSSLEPDLVVPMHYSIPGLQVEQEPVTLFLREMGVSQSAPMGVLKMPLDKASDETRVVILEPQAA